MARQRGRGNGTSRIGRRVLRRAGAAAGAGILAAGLAVAPVEAAASSAHLVDYGDWSAGSYWGGQGYGDQGYGDQSGQGDQGYGGSDGTSGSSTVDSQAATASESRGVVLIDTELYSGSEAAGTGIVLTSSGTVVTNYHVVEGSTTVKVTVATTGKTYTADLVGADQTSDIAVLQLQGASGLATADLDDDSLAVGDDVTAVGNAGGTGTLTAADGEVTALDQKITTEAEDAVAAETLTGLIETDADVVAGDSGGPLLDDEGEVTGIDTAASSGSDIQGYAIPIASALKIVDQVESGTETAAVRIGPAAYLGVQVTTTTTGYSSGDTSGSFGGGWGDPYGSGSGSDDPGDDTGSTGSTGGATVAGVEDGGPAADAGLQAGDVITTIGSTTISSADDLTSALAKYQPGDKVSVGWTDSSGEQHTATVTLGSSPVN